ncbi:MAG TPA: heavy metal-responsive transcriptional regulator [Candidatus Acidoferrales bacterium]|nr:heavy metal-responsive transcriptional regulator [Candidatus Acidoferrales bacterium]
MKDGTRIGELARAAGSTVQTIRYYERLGLLPSPARSASGYRLYTREALERLRFIRQAQAARFRLEEIKEILRLRYAGRSPCDCVRKMLEQRLEEVERELADLARFRRVLRRVLNRSQQLPRLPHSASAICPLIETIPSTGRKAKGGKNK